jgi:hypothetical protein
MRIAAKTPLPIGAGLTEASLQEANKEPLPGVFSPLSSPLAFAKEKDPAKLDKKDSLPKQSPAAPLPKEDDVEDMSIQQVKMPEFLDPNADDFIYEGNPYLTQLKEYLEANGDPSPPEIRIQGEVFFGKFSSFFSSVTRKEVLLLLEKRAQAGGSVILHFDSLNVQIDKNPEFPVPSWVGRLEVENCDCQLDFSKASSLRSLEIGILFRDDLNLSDAAQLEDVVISLISSEYVAKVIISPYLKNFTLYENHDIHPTPIDFTQARALEFVRLGAHHGNATYKLPPTVKEIQMVPRDFSGYLGSDARFTVTVDASDCQGLSQQSSQQLARAEQMEAKILFPLSQDDYQKKIKQDRLQKEEEDHTLTVGDGTIYREDQDLSQFTCPGNQPVWNLELIGQLGHQKKPIKVKVPPTLKALKGSGIVNADLDFSQAINLTKLEFIELRRGNTLKIPPSVTDLAIQVIQGTLDLSDAVGLSQDAIDRLKATAQQSNGTIIENNIPLPKVLQQRPCQQAAPDQKRKAGGSAPVQTHSIEKVVQQKEERKEIIYLFSPFDVGDSDVETTLSTSYPGLAEIKSSLEKAYQQVVFTNDPQLVKKGEPVLFFLGKNPRIDLHNYSLIQMVERLGSNVLILLFSHGRPFSREEFKDFLSPESVNSGPGKDKVAFELLEKYRNFDSFLIYEYVTTFTNTRIDDHFVNRFQGNPKPAQEILKKLKEMEEKER